MQEKCKLFKFVQLFAAFIGGVSSAHGEKNARKMHFLPFRAAKLLLFSDMGNTQKLVFLGQGVA